MIIMKLVAIEVPVKEIVYDIKFIWSRGDLTRETKRTYELTPERPRCEIGETFLKLSSFYRSPKNGKYQSKLAHITVKGSVSQ